MQTPPSTDPKTAKRTLRKKQLTTLQRQAPLIVAGFIALIGFLVAIFWLTLPDVTQLSKFAPSGAIELYDGRNQLVSTIEGTDEKEFVPISTIPLTMQHAMLAAEDHTFYQNKGVDPRGIARAFVANLLAGRVVEGGSTITMQLAKIRFFDRNERSIVQKLREMALATQLEKHYSKKQILEMYLNEVYFGHNAYGIEMAAMRYFGKSAHRLTLPESAFLAGLVRAPSYLGNPDHLSDARKRQQEVLDAMAQLHFITAAAAQSAAAAPLTFSRSQLPIRKYPYYMSAVLNFLHTQLSDQRIEEGGLRVFTNLDQAAQTIAEHAIAHGIPGAPPQMNEAALASVRVKDGAVIALVGGMGNYWDNQWNSATHPHTIGSAFKPFVYLTGFMQGIFTPMSMIDDDPIVIHQKGAPDYIPRNFTKDFLGPIPVWEALALSRNVCAVRAAAMEGTENIIRTARLAGITSPLDPHISLALGASAASPVEMASAYSTFARGGVHIAPLLVRHIDGRRGALKTFRPVPQQVFPLKPLKMLISCMHLVVQQGTGVEAQLPGRPVAGKTGTTDQGRDLWFVGFTPDLATAVWGGNKEHKALAGNVTGGVVMAGIWRRYNEGYYRAHPTPRNNVYAGSPNKAIWMDLLNPGPVLSVPKSEESAGSGAEAQPEEGNSAHAEKSGKRLRRQNQQAPPEQAVPPRKTQHKTEAPPAQASPAQTGDQNASPTNEGNETAPDNIPPQTAPVLPPMHRGFGRIPLRRMRPYPEFGPPPGYYGPPGPPPGAPPAGDQDEGYVRPSR